VGLFGELEIEHRRADVAGEERLAHEFVQEPQDDGLAGLRLVGAQQQTGRVTKLLARPRMDRPQRERDCLRQGNDDPMVLDQGDDLVDQVHRVLDRVPARLLRLALSEVGERDVVEVMVGLEFFERSEGDLTLVNGARIGLRPERGETAANSGVQIGQPAHVRALQKPSHRHSQDKSMSWLGTGVPDATNQGFGPASMCRMRRLGVHRPWLAGPATRRRLSHLFRGRLEPPIAGEFFISN
jgi:hypothetical protein